MKFDKYIKQEFSLTDSSTHPIHNKLPFITFVLSLLGLSPLVIALLLPDGTVVARVPLWAYALCSFAAFLVGLYTEKVNTKHLPLKTRGLNGVGVMLSIFGMLLYLYGLPLLLATYH
jgi:hypothetical protein